MLLAVGEELAAEVAGVVGDVGQDDDRLVSGPVQAEVGGVAAGLPGVWVMVWPVCQVEVCQKSPMRVFDWSVAVVGSRAAMPGAVPSRSAVASLARSPVVETAAAPGA